jgi:hypothetical protein
VPSCGATNSNLKHKLVKPLTHIPFTRSLKQSVPIYFPLRSWPAVVPVDWNHISQRGRGGVNLDALQGLGGPLWGIIPCQLLILITLGLPTWHGSPFHSTSEPGPQLHSLLQSSGRRPWNHIGGVHFRVSGASIGCRAWEWGSITQWGSSV